MSSLSFLPVVQQHLTRYGITAYTVLGNIGLLINIAIFSQPAHRRNPCSLLILSTSSCAWIGLNIAIIPVLYGLGNPNPATTSYLFCQLQFYLRHSINQMMRTFFILACADRYAISSQHPRIRSLSRYKVVIRVIPCVILFWLWVAIFPTALNTLANGRCASRLGLNAMLVSIYILIVLGIVPLLCLLTFSVLLTINLKQMRSRVQAATNGNQPLRKRDQDLVRMLLVEIAFYISTTIPLTIMLVYRAFTQNVTKSSDTLLIESFVNYFTSQFLLYANNAVSFWIYVCASRSYRLQVKKWIVNVYEWATRRGVRTIEATSTVRTG